MGVSLCRYRQHKPKLISSARTPKRPVNILRATVQNCYRKRFSLAYFRGCRVFAFAPALLSAQNDPYGRITGQVKDSTGAAAPAASVRLRNLDTNVTTTTTTNAEGFYELSQLNPGSYRIEIELKGFKQYDRGPIELHVGDVLSLDAALQLGSFSEKIIVTADAAIVESTNASLGQVVQHQSIADLPLPAGSPMYLLQLVPGVAAGTSPTTPWLPNAVNTLSGALAGGTRSGASEYMLDGTRT